MSTHVRAGRETGEYHLILCNLAFGIQWQEIKDVLRAGSPRHGHGPFTSVKHVHIWPGMGQGYAVLTNEKEFLSAYDFMEGLVIRGRAVMASARNLDQSVPLGYQDPSRNSHASSLQYDCFSPHSIQPIPAQYLQFGFVKNTCHHSLASSYLQIANKHRALSEHSSGRGGGHVHPVSGTIPSIHNFVASKINDREYFERAGYVPLIGNSSSNYTQYPQHYLLRQTKITVEFRRVLISNLSISTSPEMIRNLISRHTSISSTLIQNCDRPRHGNGNLRSHCVVVMNNHDNAKAVVKLCHDTVLDGRRLRCKIDVHGVKENTLNNQTVSEDLDGGISPVSDSDTDDIKDEDSYQEVDSTEISARNRQRRASAPQTIASPPVANGSMSSIEADSGLSSRQRRSSS